MAYVGRFRLTGEVAAIPHVGLAKTIGRKAVRLYREATPVRSGRMRSAWRSGVKVTGSGGSRTVTIAVYNPTRYAVYVVANNSSRFNAAARNLARYTRALLESVK